MSDYVDTILLKHFRFHTGFRKRDNKQYCFFIIPEKWKSIIDKRKLFAALLTDLSKAFYYFLHDLLLVGLDAYGFTFKELKLIRSY